MKENSIMIGWVIFTMAGLFSLIYVDKKERKEQTLHPEIVTIDSCEYIIQHGFIKTEYVHKANCKNHKFK